MKIVDSNEKVEETSHFLEKKILEWIESQRQILSLGKTMQIQIHVKNCDVKGDITIFPDSR